MKRSIVISSMLLLLFMLMPKGAIATILPVPAPEQLQVTDWSCGIHSAYRLLGAYGQYENFSAMKDDIGTFEIILGYNYELGHYVTPLCVNPCFPIYDCTVCPPDILVPTVQGQLDISLDTGSGKPDKVLVADLQRYRPTFRTADRQDMAALFAKIDSGRPVMALIQVGTGIVDLNIELARLLTGLFIIGPDEIRYPELHFIVVNGYDDQVVHWYDTDEYIQKHMSHQDFYARWNWALVSYDASIKAFFEDVIDLHPRTIMWIDEPYTTFTVTPTAHPNGSISPAAPQTIDYGSPAYFALEPDECYHTSSVTGCNGTWTEGNLYSTGAITEDCTVEAFFGINTFTLGTTKAGTGTGTVTSTPSGISCGPSSTSCGASFPQDCPTAPSSVVLKAEPVLDPPDSASEFAGWSGACTGNDPCTVTMDGVKQVTAAFNIQPPVASFTATPTTVYVPSLAVNFTNQSIRAWPDWLETAPYTYEWNFGDGTAYINEIHQQNPTHVYHNAGTYTVSLTVRNPNPTIGTDTMTRTGYITAEPCPTPPVRIVGGNYYASLQEAYDVAMDNDIIEVLAVDLFGDLNADSSMTVTLNGGYNCGFDTQIGSSGIQGSIITSLGTLIIKDVILKK